MSERDCGSPENCGGEVSLYIHVPFCERKCGYCAFNSHVPGEGEKEQWLRAVIRELELRRKDLGGVSLKTLYIGGGTPSILEPGLAERLLDAIGDNFDISEYAEATIEANPSSLTADHLAVWKSKGITRVSIGVQSFDDAELEFMGRLHGAARAYESVAASLAAGFDVSIDLIFGLPHQSLRTWGESLKLAVSSGAHHISLYQLSIEPGTQFENIDRSLLPDGYGHYRTAQWYLPRKGYKQYEISNFAKPGKESRHNLNYWREGGYIGIGPGASGYLNGTRYRNISGLADYATAIRNGEKLTEFEERLSGERLAREAAILALRTSDGIDRAEFAKKYGRAALSKIEDTLGNLPGDLFIAQGRKLALSQRGMRVANIIWAEIV